jgi:histidine triad (HIT) family protein
METIFSKIVRREIPADIVYEDERALAFRDIHPQAPVHVLIIPKQPIARASDLEPQHEALAGHLLVVAAEVARREKLARGYRLIINCGPEGCQSVYHLHVHLLGGKQLGWPGID